MIQREVVFYVASVDLIARVKLYLSAVDKVLSEGIQSRVYLIVKIFAKRLFGIESFSCVVIDKIYRNYYLIINMDNIY